MKIYFVLTLHKESVYSNIILHSLELYKKCLFKKILSQYVWSILYYYYDMSSLFLVENKKGVLGKMPPRKITISFHQS